MRGETFFDDLTWGMSTAEVAAKYAISPEDGSSSLMDRREIAGVPVWVRFMFDESGLSRISVGSRRSYEEWGDADEDEHALVTWISKRAGPYSERDAAKVSWHLPTVEIWTFVDESLGLYFEQVVS